MAWPMLMKLRACLCVCELHNILCSLCSDPCLRVGKISNFTTAIVDRRLHILFGNRTDEIIISIK